MTTSGTAFRGRWEFGALAAEVAGVDVLRGRSAQLTAITADSREVRPGTLFVARDGMRTDGHAFISDALARGAAALIVDASHADRWRGRAGEVASTVGLGTAVGTRRAFGLLCAAFHEHPSRRLRLIGVTGTNGKTTTSLLVRQMLADAGVATGATTTCGSYLGSEEEPAERTTPEADRLQALLAAMVEQGLTHAVVESSSHGLWLDRLAGCEFDVGVFTNLGDDHLELHGDRAGYLDAKMRLFRSLPGGDARSYAVVNAHEPAADKIRSECPARIVSYGVDRDDVDYGVEPVRRHGFATVCRFNLPAGTFEGEVRLPGRFNLLNAGAALAVACEEGVAPDVAVAALGAIASLPGRGEAIPTRWGARLMVDFAHNPHGLDNLLGSLRAETTGRLIVVFGCHGKGQRELRKAMGAAVDQHADIPIITSDNSYWDDPAEIASDIALGMRRGTHEFVADRRAAIKHALELSEAGDLVVVAGKGHERFMEVGGRRIPFDDLQVARELVDERGARLRTTPPEGMSVVGT